MCMTSKRAHTIAFSVFLAIGSGALRAAADAQEPTMAPPVSPASVPPSAAAVPAAPEQPQVPGPAAPVAARSGIACVIGYHPPEYPDSARTATQLVCDELRKRGVPIGMASYNPGNAAAAYVVHLDQLGTTFFLRVVHEDPVGVPRSTRRLSMVGLAEAEVAAPRLADAIVYNRDVQDTQRYENVVGSEARRYKKRSGEAVIGFGLAGLSIPGADSYMGPALNVFGYYETVSYGLGLQAHIGDASTDEAFDARFAAFSVGGRYYFSDGNITPLVGAGLAMASIEIGRELPEVTELHEGSGLTAFGEVGLEFFRLYSTHLIASLRVDAPFFALKRTDYDDRRIGAVKPPAESEYHVPITVNVGVGF